MYVAGRELSTNNLVLSSAHKILRPFTSGNPVCGFVLPNIRTNQLKISGSGYCGITRERKPLLAPTQVINIQLFSIHDLKSTQA